MNTLSKLTLTAALGLTMSAQGKIHETYAQSVARYGQPASSNEGVVRWNITDDFSITATFNDSGYTCDTIYFDKWDGPYTEANLVSIIKSNVPYTRYFKEVTNEAKIDGARAWESTGGKETILYQRVIGDATTGRDPFEISVWSKGAHQRAAAAKNNNGNTPAVAM